MPSVVHPLEITMCASTALPCVRRRVYSMVARNVGGQCPPICQTSTRAGAVEALALQIAIRLNAQKVDPLLSFPTLWHEWR